MIYKSIFIDLDDTLWDTYHNNKECLEELYTDYHFNRYYASFEAFFDIYMPHNLDLWAQIPFGGNRPANLNLGSISLRTSSVRNRG